MAFKSPPEITVAGVELGVVKSRLSWDKALASGFLAGAYIAFAGLLAIVASAGLKPAKVGGIITLVTGSVFALGLILVVVAGSELLTGNMAFVPLGVFGRRIGLPRLGHNFLFVLIGNLAGSLFVAYVLAVRTGVVTEPADLARLGTIALGKAVKESDLQIFLRAIGCNWLVCLAVWMSLAADDIGGKILAIFFPIMAFVALGFDHVVANMFFLPAAIFAHVHGIGWGDVLKNWVFAFLGNLVGAAVFVAGFYHYLYGRPAAGTPSAGGTLSANGRRDAVGARAPGAVGDGIASATSRPSA